MSIINLTSKAEYELSEQDIKHLSKAPKDYIDYFNCSTIEDKASGVVLHKESGVRRIRKVWRNIDVYLVETTQSNKVAENDGNIIDIPDINDPYLDIERKLNDKRYDNKVQYTRYFDGIDKYDNETFEYGDVEMLQRGRELKKPFSKGFFPQGSFVDADGCHVWCSADEYSIYYRRSRKGAYGHCIFIWADRIINRVKNDISSYKAVVIFEILKCKAQAIMDIDYVTDNIGGNGNHLLRTLQPAYFRMRENSIANAIAYFFIINFFPKKTQYEDNCFTLTYCKPDGNLCRLFVRYKEVLPDIICNWINTKYNYAYYKRSIKCSDNLQPYQRFYDLMVEWFNLAINSEEISEKHLPMMMKIEKEMAELFETTENLQSITDMTKSKTKEVPDSQNWIMTPKEIKIYLDRYVIGQDKAKRALCVAVYNHYKRIGMNLGRNEDNQLAKSNLIMIGETGSGKTLLAKTIARYLDVPIFIQDCTKITEAGYVGQDVEECLKGLLMAAGGDIMRAERGIIVLDEVDKLASCNAGASITRDVAGEGVQQALLKIVEGDKVQVQQQSGRRHPEAKCDIIDTTNILFIATGAFPGIDSIIRKRFGASEVGFCANNAARDKNADFTSMVCAEDFRQFGFIPEFIGRFPITTNVNKLNEEDFIRILTEPADSIIAQYTDMLAEDNTKLIFTDDALHSIAHYSLLSRTGARGLRGVIENILGDIMFDAPSNRYDKDSVTVVIDQDYVEQKINHNLIPNKAI